MKLLNDELMFSLIDQDRFAISHGASGTYLGAGLLYYTLTYMSKAKLCVCLGSGSGFVPKMMRQAQRDLNLISSKTILVDANLKNTPWGDPDYHDKATKFTAEFSEIEIIKELTGIAVQSFEDGSIDFLHIDADHSYKGVTDDFYNYKKKVKSGGVITFHDTKSPDCGVERFLKSHVTFFVDFAIGNGTAVMVNS